MNCSIDDLSITNIRLLAIDAVENANSGHPGMPMGAAPMAYVLWTKVMNYNPKHPNWINRDRFVLSAGHGSMLLYSLLHLSKMDLSIEDLKKFRRLYSKTPGHPEYGHTTGVEATTGPLGQGLSMAVGMAMGERYMAAKFNKEELELINHYTYAICGDGDLMEGVAQEASSLAGHLKLGKLIVLYDSNNISLDGGTELSYTENVEKKYEAMGWEVFTVEDGNNLDAIEQKLKEAKKNESKPSLIIVKTTIGYGSPNKGGKSASHGSPLGKAEMELVKKNYNWNHEPFFVDSRVEKNFEDYIALNEQKEQKWQEVLKEYQVRYPNESRLLEKIHTQPIDIDNSILPIFEENTYTSTREASEKILNAFASNMSLIGGSADLSSSNRTYLANKGDFHPNNYSGQNIHFGVREFSMGSILNGLALYGGLRPYGATFLVFSDYMRPAIRLSALMNQPVTYIFTHDSIHYGEDGPTHQPIEHIPSLRLIPNLLVFRPADANESVEVYKSAFSQTNRPSAIILSRQDLPVITPPPGLDNKVKKGGYVFQPESREEIDVVLIATGSEVTLADNVRHRLEADGVSVRIVSMPCLELFNEQDQAYKDQIIPPAVHNRVILELAAPYGWDSVKGERGINIGIDSFAASAPGNDLVKEFGFTEEAISNKIQEYLKRNLKELSI
ncbi:transketolase [Neobacillus cucumis]|uniref:transketolase n=1 Tax=Neobacillus cucumis TaxID=1740721 RepID=UPI00203D482F|nr:transketolase [Neobacillus cucumis]MCM3729802.1 transketolase [Neobacillus cucumis]